MKFMENQLVWPALNLQTYHGTMIRKLNLQPIHTRRITPITPRHPPQVEIIQTKIRIWNHARSIQIQMCLTWHFPLYPHKAFITGACEGPIWFAEVEDFGCCSWGKERSCGKWWDFHIEWCEGEEGKAAGEEGKGMLEWGEHLHHGGSSNSYMLSRIVLINR